MSCNGCGQNKPRRHQPTVLVRDADASTPDLVMEAKKGSFSAQPTSAPKSSTVTPVFKEEEAGLPLAETAVDAFHEAKKLSFEDIMTRMAQQQRFASAEIEKAYSEMTDAMRHFHILNLLSVANYENMSTPGMSPDQAVVGLWTALSRKDFNFINDLYPSLKEKVEYRYRELMAKKILL